MSADTHTWIQIEIQTLKIDACYMTCSFRRSGGKKNYEINMKITNFEEEMAQVRTAQTNPAHFRIENQLIDC